MALISTSCSPTTETLQLLRFADLAEGDLRLTADGILFAGLGVDERKALFARHLATYVPLAAHIKRILDERPNHNAPIIRFTDELSNHMSEDSADQTIRTVVNWARYGELFSYDEASGILSQESQV